MKKSQIHFCHPYRPLCLAILSTRYPDITSYLLSAVNYSRTSILVTPSVTHPCVTKIGVVTKIEVHFYYMNLHKWYMAITLLHNTHFVTTIKTWKLTFIETFLVNNSFESFEVSNNILFRWFCLPFWGKMQLFSLKLQSRCN